MKHFLILVTLLVSVVLSVTSVAAESTKTHQGRGVITGIDAANDTVHIDHEPIKSLNWPRMEMPFEVKDDSILKGLKEDQTVEFDIVKTDNGYRITRIRPAT